MTLLVLAGTSEARVLARELAARGVAAIASLAGATRSPEALDLPLRVGGFGGQAGFEAYLEAEGITAVIDATHPFAARITERTAAVARARGLPCLHLLRPGWEPREGDRWTMIDGEEDVADHVQPGQALFLATGRQTLGRFASLGRCRLILRQIDPPDEAFPYPGGRFLVGRPPFPVQEERALFEELGVDWLVVKNAGGAASRSKLDAAAEMGLPVLMIRRPAPPVGHVVDTVSAALAWVETL